MPFTSMDQHYHNTIMVSKIYLMMRITAYLYGDVFFFNDIGYLYSTLSIPRNVRLQKA